MGYREHPPPSELHPLVEAFWSSTAENFTANAEPVRILPDGCSDIVHFHSAAGPSLIFVGPMTRFKMVSRTDSSFAVGVRFRPEAQGPSSRSRYVP